MLVCTPYVRMGEADNDTGSSFLDYTHFCWGEGGRGIRLKRVVWVCHLCGMSFISHFQGFESLLEASRCSELSMLYSFFIRFKEGQGLVCKAFGEYMKVGMLHERVGEGEGTGQFPWRKEG